MSTTKEEIRGLLDTLPDDCSLEDVQYHLFVLEKVRKGLDRADTEPVCTQQEVEGKFSRWTS